MNFKKTIVIATASLIAFVSLPYAGTGRQRIVHCQVPDVRVIAVTNRNLKHVVAENGFRGDLYYRLNRFPIEIPPFRDRSSDIDPLSTYFLRRVAEERPGYFYRQ